MKLYIFCGLPNSGKTTKAKELSETYNAVLVSQDEEIKQLFAALCPIAELYDRILAEIKSLLLSGKSVIYDSPALSVSERQYILEVCNVSELEPICIFMDTPFEVIKQRGAIMPFEWLETPTANEGFELIVCNDGY